MVTVPTRVHLSAFVSRFSEWERVGDLAANFSRSRGLVARTLQVPGLLSSVLRAATGDMSVLGQLFQQGWVNGGWTSILSGWLDEQLLAADPAMTRPVTIRENDRFSCVIYRGVGLAVRRNIHGKANVLCAPTDDAVRWVASLMNNAKGGVVRLVPPKGRSHHDSDEDMPDDPNTSRWRLEEQAWPDTRGWVEGPWSPTLDEMTRALFPLTAGAGKQKSGRSVLLLGPPGAGKTETAVRACLHHYGANSRVLVVHGTAFGRGEHGMTGRDAVSLVRAFGACAFIVDDMPPVATVAMLEQFEALHREGVPVVITLMTDGSRPSLPGLRPGRVDEMVEFGVPDAEGRERLMRAVGGEGDLWADLAQDKRAEGMTPAYLRELALRVKAGVAPERALTSLAMQREIAT
jgi:hypothetical protein